MAGPDRSYAPRAPRWYLVLAALVGLSVWFYLRKPAREGPAVFEGPTMGTSYRVVLAAPLEPARRAELAGRIHDALERVNAAMSTYLPTSEVSRFASATASAAFSLSAPTFEVLSRALTISRATGGAFDVTVRPLVDAWGFGPDGRPAHRPEAAELEALRARVGYEKLTLDEEARTLTKAVDGLSIDLSAIAKGYAVDQVARALEADGIDAYLVEVGGEVRARGRSARGRPWRVGIEAPEPGRRHVLAAVELSDHGLATSGNYRNFYVEDGVRYAHTIDPRAGGPVRHRLQSVSVIADEAAIADGWATALMVVGPEAARRLADENRLAVLLIVSDDEGGLRMEPNLAFEPFLARAEEGDDR